MLVVGVGCRYGCCVCVLVVLLPKFPVFRDRCDFRAFFFGVKCFDVFLVGGSDVSWDPLPIGGGLGPGLQLGVFVLLGFVVRSFAGFVRGDADSAFVLERVLRGNVCVSVNWYVMLRWVIALRVFRGDTEGCEGRCCSGWIWLV